jgi:predicted Zn finger-like uncharacterized protein
MNTITVFCPNCQARMRAPDNAVGKQVRCPSCERLFRVEQPVAEESVVPPPTAPPPAAPAALPEPEGFPEPEMPNVRRRGDANALVDFLMFRKMVAPFVIMILFWLAVAGFMIGGLIMILLGIATALSTRGAGEGILALFFSVFVGLGYMIVGPIVARVYAEVLIILFRIYETLVDIKKNTDRD